MLPEGVAIGVDVVGTVGADADSGAIAAARLPKVPVLSGASGLSAAGCLRTISLVTRYDAESSAVVAPRRAMVIPMAG